MPDKQVVLDDIGELDASIRQSVTVEPASDINPIIIQKDYFIMLINSTDNVVRLVRINGGPWAHTEPLGRTCGSRDYYQCANHNNYKLLCVVNCNSDVKVEVAWQKSDNTWCVASWNSFHADCKYKGGIIQLVD